MSRIRIGSIAVLTLCGLAIASQPIKAADAPVAAAYPKDFTKWKAVTRMALVAPTDRLARNFGGVHNTFANPAALEAMKAGKPFPDGAVLVLDLFEDGGTAGKPSEGTHKGVFVMHKDAKANPTTGGWLFDEFKGDAKDKGVVTDGKKQCYSCHATRKKTDGVYSTVK